ncbi:prepilin-type N-terminal cleavage/methylation domain-containing protein [bacterium]|jgi:prepilin-type N-terminal cleavage/methylation domain-containing protein|nr:prepilin-type N-terminal cleavage/methylation domain-containing protein [bacterium]
MNKLIKQAFTLIELLVVIAIIGILSGLIVVSMSGVTQKATIAKAQVFSNSLRNSLMLNLVSEWRLDGDAIDSWGSNDGTVAGATWETNTNNCINNSCLLFSGGVGDYVQMNAITELTTGKSFILSVWVYPQTTGTYRTIMGYNSTHRILIENDAIMLSQQDTNFYSGADVPDNKWTYVIYWNSGTEERWYINGSLSGTPHTTALAEWDQAFKLGQYDLVNYPYKGRIDEVRIYNAVFTVSQIKEQYYIGLNKLLSKGEITEEEYNNKIEYLLAAK